MEVQLIKSSDIKLMQKLICHIFSHVQNSGYIYAQISKDVIKIHKKKSEEVGWYIRVTSG